MKKKWLLSIFLMFFCFILKLENYSALIKLNCNYTIEAKTQTNYKEAYNSIWLHFERETETQKWEMSQIYVKEAGKYKKDMWRDFVYDSYAISLEDYEVEGLNISDTTCPSVLEFDEINKKIKLRNDIYILDSQKRVDSSENTSEYRCNYVKMLSKDKKVYQISYYSNGSDEPYIYNEEKTKSLNNDLDRKIDASGGLTWIDEGEGDNNFKDLLCPSIAIDDGTTLKIPRQEYYNLSEYNKNVCTYFRKNDVNTYYYNISKKKNSSGKYPVSYIQISNGNVAASKVVEKEGIKTQFWNDTKCPLSIKVTDGSLSFPGVTYFYLSSSNQSQGVYDNYEGSLLSCGNGLIDKIPHIIPRVVSSIYLIIQIAVPVVLVIMGMLDLIKGITAAKEDEIKKGQKIFIKRLIAAAMIFFVFVIVKLIISVVADASSNNILECAKCFLERKCN